METAEGWEMTEEWEIKRVALIYDIQYLSNGYGFRFLDQFTNEQLQAFLGRLSSLK